MIVYISVISGLLLGAGVNYLADVLPVRRRLTRPWCFACGSDTSWSNYLLWFRSCKVCGSSRSLRTWMTEGILAAAGGIMAVSPPERLGLWAGLVLLSFLILVTVIDIEHRLILHITSAAGAILALWIGISIHSLSATLIGGVVGFGAMLGIYYAGYLYLRFSRRIHGEVITEEAIGFGDVNLAGITGLLLGWPGITLGLILAILLAGAVSIIFLLWKIIGKGYTANLALPYGPFLTASVFLLLFFNPQSWFR